MTLRAKRERVELFKTQTRVFLLITRRTLYFNTTVQSKQPRDIKYYNLILPIITPVRFSVFVF